MLFPTLPLLPPWQSWANVVNKLAQLDKELEELRQAAERESVDLTEQVARVEAQHVVTPQQQYVKLLLELKVGK
jgi:cell division septum initiation protein DivIVA